MIRQRPPRLARWLLALLPLGGHRPQTEADLLELYESRTVEHGSRYAARRFWGDVVSLAKRECLDWSEWRTWRWNTGEVLQDLDYAARLTWRTPGIVAITAGGLALAIAVCTSVFSLMNAVVFRSTGVEDPAATVRVFRKYQNGVGSAWRYADYLQLRDGTSGVAIEATLPESATFTMSAAADEPPSVAVSFVTGGYLAMLNRRVALGRTLTPDDDAAASPVVVLSHATWTRRLAGDPSILGRPVWLNGVAFTVVGVAERGFTASRQSAPELWVPISTYHLALGGPPLGHQTANSVTVVGRLAPGTPRAQAETALSSIAARISSSDAQEELLTGVQFAGLDDSVTGSELSQRMLALTIVAIVIGLILLLACANVSNLLLASASTRAQEVGVRLALGASAGRIVRQLLTESLALGVIAGCGGLLLTMWLGPILARVVRAPAAFEASLDVRVYLFAAAMSMLAGLGAGLAPARHALRDRFGGSLRTNLQGGVPVESSRLRSGLIAVQAAASIMLVVLAALLTRATVRAMHVDVGFDAAQLLTVSPAFGSATQDAARKRAYWDAALERVAALPGVAAATIAEQVPFGGSSRVMVFRRDSARYTLYFNDTRADYFTTVGLRILRGRTFTDAEVTAAAPVAVINETIARDFFPGEDPIGQSLERVTEERGPVIIGVVSDAITARLRDLRSPSIYQPMKPAGSGRMIVRTSGAPTTMIPSIRSALHALDPRVGVAISPVSEGLRGQVDEPRMLASLAMVLAAIALVLASVGIYGVTTFVVGQRTAEVGLRIALGATSHDVMRLLVVDSLRPVAFGLAAGVLGALVCTRAVAGVLFGVSSVDPAAFATAIALLLGTALGAILIPTRRAAASDPASILRRL